MSDLGLDADVSLDIRQALEQVARVEAALTRATTGMDIVVTADTSAIPAAVSSAVDSGDSEVVVTGQADELTGDVTSAIDAADTTATVSGDATQLTGAVTSAVDAADTTAEITADAGALTGSIDSAVNAADTQVEITSEAAGITGDIDAAVDAADTSVDIDADSSGIRAATRDADALSAALVASSSRGLELRTILQLGAGGAVLAGFQQLINAASDLEQSIGGTTAIFGPAEARVVSFARSASESAGLTEESARTLTSRIGGLLQGFDFTQRESAEMSVTLAQLGADLAATFGGTTQEAVEALGAAIRGETDPIERFGISITAARADLKAVELGLAETTSEVDANARAQGVLALITEQSANAQGQFAREVNTTAGQLERARAEFGNTAASIGTTMQPAVNELLAAVRADLIPAIGELGRELGPRLVSIVTALLPAFGATTDVLISLAPVLTTIATVVAAIPDPVLQVAAAFFALRAAGGPLGSVLDGVVRLVGNLIVPTTAMSGAMAGATGRAGVFRGALSGISASGLILNGVLIAGAVVFAAWANSQAKAKQAAAELEAQNQNLRTVLEGTGDSANTLVDAFDTFAEEGLLVESRFGNLKFSAETVSSALRDMGITTEDLAEAARGGADGVEALIAQVRTQTDVSEEDADALRGLVANVEAAARANVDAAVATGEYTDAQVESALANTAARDGTESYAAALGYLQEQTARSAEMQDALAEAAGGVDAEGQSHRVTQLGLALEYLQSRTGDVEGKFTAFALAADAAGLSGAELEAVAEALGVDAESLGVAIEQVAAPINELASAATGTLPSITDLAGSFEEFSVEGFRDELATAYTAVVDFQANLQALADRPRLAAAAAVLGPEFAQELANAARDGRVGTLNEIELLLAGLEIEGVNLEQLITGEIGPNLAAGTGAVGTAMTDAFGANFNPESTVVPSIASVEGNIRDAQEGIRAAGAGAGQAGTEGFDSGFNPGEGVPPSIRSIEGTIEAERPNLREAGRGLGFDASSGVTEGFVPDFLTPLANARGQVAAETPNFVAQVLGLGTAGTAAFDSGFNPDTTVAPSIRSIEGTVEANKPTIIESLLGLGSAGTTGFDTGFRPANSIPTRTAHARQAVDNERPNLIATMLGLGSAGTSGFGSGLSGMPGQAGSKSDAARARIAAGGGLFERAALATGTAASIGLAQGMQGMSSAARNSVNQAMGAARSAGAGARSTGYSIGAALAGGMVAGIKANAGSAAAQAAQMVRDAASAARAEARISSPSALFRDEIGLPIAEGVAVGIERGAGLAADAMVSIVDTLAGTSLGEVAPGVALPASALPLGAAPIGAGGNTYITVQGVPGMVQITPSAGPGALRDGQAAARGFLDSVGPQGLRSGAHIAGKR